MEKISNRLWFDKGNIEYKEEDLKQSFNTKKELDHFYKICPSNGDRFPSHTSSEQCFN